MDNALETREKIAVDMRLSGAPITEIAVRLGYTDTRPVYKILQRVLAKAQPELEDIEHLRAQEAARYDKLLEAWWPRALGWTENIGQDDEQYHPPEKHAAQMILSIMRDRAKLLGIQNTDKSGVLNMSALDAAIVAAQEQLGEVIEGEILDE